MREDVADEFAILDELDAEVLVAHEKGRVLEDAALRADDLHSVGEMATGVFETDELLVGDARPLERVEIVAIANDAVDADDPAPVPLGECGGVLDFPRCHRKGGIRRHADEVVSECVLELDLVGDARDDLVGLGSARPGAAQDRLADLDVGEDLKEGDAGGEARAGEDLLEAVEVGVGTDAGVDHSWRSLPVDPAAPSGVGGLLAKRC